MTTKEDIKEWVERGKKSGATHVIIACDTFSYEDYPVMVMPGENIKEKLKYYNSQNMQTVMEIYNLSMDIEKQLKERKSWNL